MVDQDGNPADQDAAGRQVEEPVEDRQSAVGQAHEGEEHEGRLEENADVGHAPRCCSQKYFGGLALQCQAVEHTGSCEQSLVGRGPGRRDHDGVDHRGDGLDASTACGNDERALSRCAGLIGEAGVVAGNQHADDEDGQDVEDGDAGKHSLAGVRDRSPRIARLGSGHGNAFDAGEGEDGVGHDGPVAEKLAPAATADVLDERAGVLPVAEADPIHPWDSTEVDDQAQDDEENNEEDLQDGKEELDFAVHPDQGNADDEGQHDDHDDPHGAVDVGPELEEDADCRDLGRDGQPVSVDDVVSVQRMVSSGSRGRERSPHLPNSKAQRGINEELGMADEGTGDGQQRGDFSQGELHGAHDQADGGIAKQGAERAAGLDGPSKTQEQTGALQKAY